MQTLTQDRFPKLPNPPISSADVALSDNYEMSINDRFIYSLKTINKKSERMAMKRDSSKPNVGDLKGDRKSRQAHRIGYIGELVVAEQLTLTFDTEISRAGDHGWDHTFYSDLGIKFDTKTTATQTERPQLIVSANDTPSADFFVLVHLQDNEKARIVGFIDRISLTNRDPERWPGESLNYVAGWEELYPPRFFDPLVKRQAVVRSRNQGSAPMYCQNCGLILFENVERRIYISDIDEEIGVCPDCASLLEAAKDQGTASDFTIYKRPVL